MYNGELIAGGDFVVVRDEIIREIARWNGTTWHTLGNGPPDDSVTALTVFKGELIAGGWFSTIGGQLVNGIAAWNGTSWHAMGGMDDPVFALCVYNGDLIASGEFHFAGGVPVNCIARWDGTTWHPLGNGGNATGIGCMTVYNGDLFAGGQFPGPKNLGRWNGSTWQTYLAPAGNMSALSVYGGKLVAGVYAVSPQYPIAAAWDGVDTWQPLGNGVPNPQTFALRVYNGDLIAGGTFGALGGQIVNCIARWDGAAWHPIGGGFGHPPPLTSGIGSLLLHNGDLIAGGTFETAGGNPANGIARWRDCHVCLADVNHDLQVNIDDLVSVVSAWGPCPPQPPACPGDYEPWGGNGTVNMDDLVRVISGWNQPDFGGHIFNIDDLVAVIAHWGPCPSAIPQPVCPQDITRSGNVNIDDLVAVITAWGPCP